VDELAERLAKAIARTLLRERERLRWLRGRAGLASPAARLKQQSLQWQTLRLRLERAFRQSQDARYRRLLPLERTLNAVSPLATLERGYAIVTNDMGAVLQDVAAAPPGTRIEARLRVGVLRAAVVETSGGPPAET